MVYFLMPLGNQNCPETNFTKSSTKLANIIKAVFVNVTMANCHSLTHFVLGPLEGTLIPL